MKNNAKKHKEREKKQTKTYNKHLTVTWCIHSSQSFVCVTPYISKMGGPGDSKYFVQLGAFEYSKIKS